WYHKVKAVIAHPAAPMGPLAAVVTNSSIGMVKSPFWCQRTARNAPGTAHTPRCRMRTTGREMIAAIIPEQKPRDTQNAAGEKHRAVMATTSTAPPVNAVAGFLAASAFKGCTASVIADQSPTVSRLFEIDWRSGIGGVGSVRLVRGRAGCQ